MLSLFVAAGKVLDLPLVDDEGNVCVAAYQHA